MSSILPPLSSTLLMTEDELRHSFAALMNNSVIIQQEEDVHKEQDIVMLDDRNVSSKWSGVHLIYLDTLIINIYYVMYLYEYIFHYTRCIL